MNRQQAVKRHWFASRTFKQDPWARPQVHWLSSKHCLLTLCGRTGRCFCTVLLLQMNGYHPRVRREWALYGAGASRARP